MDREDYPYCIYCDAKIEWVTFDSLSKLIIYHCRCGETIEVEIISENDERLLSNSRSS
jgi:hypothetical protein